MEKEREDKILEAIGKQRQDIIIHVDEQFGSVVKKLEKHDEQFDKIDGRFDRLESVVLENSKDTKEIKENLNTAVTNHEQRIRNLEQKVEI